MSRLSAVRLAIAGLVLVALTVSAAEAQSRRPVRDGFWFSGGLGYGTLGCQECDSRIGGLVGGLVFGGSLSQTVLLGVGTANWVRSEDGATLTAGTLDARFRFYPTRKTGFFLTAGLGIGSISADVDGLGSASATGVSAVAGLGYDIPIGKNASLTPFLNAVGIASDNADANFNQIGLALTLH